MECSLGRETHIGTEDEAPDHALCTLLSCNGFKLVDPLLHERIHGEGPSVRNTQIDGAARRDALGDGLLKARRIEHVHAHGDDAAGVRLAKRRERLDAAGTGVHPEPVLGCELLGEGTPDWRCLGMPGPRMM